jgi:hypothetical protein
VTKLIFPGDLAFSERFDLFKSCHLFKSSMRVEYQGATTLPIKWIAARVQIGNSKGAKSVLHHWMQTPDKTVADTATTTTNSCAQLQFESTV